jgi:hypothetical protein
VSGTCKLGMPPSRSRHFIEPRCAIVLDGHAAFLEYRRRHGHDGYSWPPADCPVAFQVDDSANLSHTVGPLPRNSQSNFTGGVD